MEKKKIPYTLHILFWSIGFITWCFWVRARIEIFARFVDGYKNIGYYIHTNDHQLGWYILISAGKVILIIVSIYLLPSFGFRKSAFYRFIILLAILMSLEYLATRSYYLYLRSSISGGFRLDWDYDFLSVLSIYLFCGILSAVLVAAKNWVEEYHNLKTLYNAHQAYQQLRKKLDPHFIFNTLNNMYDIALISGNEKIQSSLLHLTETLRYALKSSNKEDVPISVELSAIKSYIELQKERFEANEIDLDVSISIDNPNRKISPLIILNYIENAFEHGYKYGQKCIISIGISEKNGQLNLHVKNSNHARRKNENGGNLKTKKLLEIKYLGKHKLNIENNKNFYSLHLWIQLA
ncbi:MAG: histidine kinase [Cytophagales bacterium]|nr:histidine kinase [Cytophagales bacterium]